MSRPLSRPLSRSLAGVVLACAALGVSCGSDSAEVDTSTDSSGAVGDVGEVTGSVKEWSVQVDTPSAPPGDVTFNITNEGTVQHEFLVVRTDQPLGSIPVKGNRFAEDDPTLTVVDEIPEFAPGDTKTLTVSLEPGSYQLVCNLPGHYSSGMHAPFTVTGQPSDSSSGSDATDSSSPENSTVGSTQSDLQSGGAGNDPGESSTP